MKKRPRPRRRTSQRISKQTSGRVSSKSSLLLLLAKAGCKFYAVNPGGAEIDVTSEVKAAAGSALVQDQTVGSRKRRPTR